MKETFQNLRLSVAGDMQAGRGELRISFLEIGAKAFSLENFVSTKAKLREISIQSSRDASSSTSTIGFVQTDRGAVLSSQGRDDKLNAFGFRRVSSAADLIRLEQDEETQLRNISERRRGQLGFSGVIEGKQPVVGKSARRSDKTPGSKNDLQIRLIYEKNGNLVWFDQEDAIRSASMALIDLPHGSFYVPVIDGAQLDKVVPQKGVLGFQPN